MKYQKIWYTLYLFQEWIEYLSISCSYICIHKNTNNLHKYPLLKPSSINSNFIYKVPNASLESYNNKKKKEEEEEKRDSLEIHWKANSQPSKFHLPSATETKISLEIHIHRADGPSHRWRWVRTWIAREKGKEKKRKEKRREREGRVAKEREEGVGGSHSPRWDLNYAAEGERARGGERWKSGGVGARARVQKGCNAFGRPKNSPRARVNFPSSRGRGRREGGLRLKSRLRFKFRWNATSDGEVKAQHTATHSRLLWLKTRRRRRRPVACRFHSKEWFRCETGDEREDPTRRFSLGRLSRSPPGDRASFNRWPVGQLTGNARRNRSRKGVSRASLLQSPAVATNFWFSAFALPSRSLLVVFLGRGCVRIWREIRKLCRATVRLWILWW